YIGEENDLCDLQPVWLSSNCGLQGRVHEPFGRNDGPNYQYGQPQFDQETIQENIDQVVAPAASKHPLLWMHGHQPLERHEDEACDEKAFEAKPIHINPRDTAASRLNLRRLAGSLDA